MNFWRKEDIDSGTVRESLTRSFEEEACLDGGEEPMAKIVKMETDKEQGFSKGKFN